MESDNILLNDNEDVITAEDSSQTSISLQFGILSLQASHFQR